MNELRQILSKHPAFDGNNTHLEKLAEEFGIKIVWCPKYHCELNPIEGFWCDLKQYVRKNNDQDFNKLNDLIIRAVEEFKEKNLNIKLWNRFWRIIDMYHNNSTYEEVLTHLFGSRSSPKTKSKKKITHFNTKIK